MMDYQIETPELTEEVWRAWIHKGKLRDRIRARRRKWIAAIAFLVVGAALMVRYFLLGT